MVIQGDQTKRRHLSAHFGLKYVSKDGVNRDRFYCKNFPNIHIFRPAKNLGPILSGVIFNASKSAFIEGRVILWLNIRLKG